MPQKLVEYFTYDEINKLIRGSKIKEMKLVIALGAGSGLRISEIIGSKRKDGKDIPPLLPDMVNLQTHQIRIIQGKGKKDRITVTSPWLNKTNISSLPIKTPRRTLQWQFTQLCKKILKKQGNVHMLRHSFGNHLINEKNLSVPYVQALMGHSRGDTTMMYAKANPKVAIQSAWEVF